MASATKALRVGGEGRTAEIDGAYFGGHIWSVDLTAERIDRRLQGGPSQPVDLPYHQAVTIIQPLQQGGIERPDTAGLGNQGLAGHPAGRPLIARVHAKARFLA
jgi:hypothetical protein